MGVDFPIPRDEMPQIRVSEVEHDARKLQMERMLLQTLVEYDQMRDVAADATHVDPVRWRQIGARKELVAYRERTSSVLAQHGPGAATTATSTYSTNDDYTLDPEGGAVRGSWRVGGGGGGSAYGYGHHADEVTGGIIGSLGVNAAKNEPPSSVRGILMVGEMPGRMENVLYALVAKSQEELSMVNRFIHDDIADSTIVHVLEPPSRGRPYHFLGYKWLVKKPARFVKYRDCLCIDYSGVTTTSQGHVVGFHMMHSFEHPDFPLMTDRNCIRSEQSLRFLYRQKHENVIQVFMVGEMDFPGGRLMRPLVTALSTDVLLAVTRLTDCAEAKRLTKMVLRFRQAREDRIYNGRDTISCCALCRAKKKFYNAVSLTDCIVCGQFVCSRCRLHRHVFISDGALGHYERVRCCRSCMVMANKVAKVESRRSDARPSSRSRHPSSSSASSSSSATGPRGVSTQYLRQRNSVQGLESFISERGATHESDETRTQRSASDSSRVVAETAIHSTYSPPDGKSPDYEYAYLEDPAGHAKKQDRLSDWMEPAGRCSDPAIAPPTQETPTSGPYRLGFPVSSASAPSTPTGPGAASDMDEKPLKITVTRGAGSNPTPYSALPRPGANLFQQTTGIGRRTASMEARVAQTNRRTATSHNRRTGSSYM